MSISSLCKSPPVTIIHSAPLSSASELMKERNTGILVVVGGNGEAAPLGIVTDRDIALKVFQDGIRADSSVDSIMSKNVITVSEDAGIADVIDKMEKNSVRRMIVQSRNGELCGVVNTDEILQLLAQELSSVSSLTRKQAPIESQSLHVGLSE